MSGKNDRDALALEMEKIEDQEWFCRLGPYGKNRAMADIALAHIKEAHAEYGELIDAAFEHCNQEEPVEGLHWGVKFNMSPVWSFDTLSRLANALWEKHHMEKEKAIRALKDAAPDADGGGS